MKNIGITQRLDTIESYQEDRASLDINWYRFFQELNVRLVPIPPLEAVAFCKEARLDALLFSGGNTLSALEPDPLNELRDHEESKLLNWALDSSLPVLGICRGAQLIAHTFGGNLEKTSKTIGEKIEIDLQELTPNFAPFPEGHQVTCYHEYSIRSLSDEFTVVATSEDGSIEAFEHKRHAVSGMMWHPERGGFNPIEKKIVSNLLKLES